MRENEKDRKLGKSETEQDKIEEVRQAIKITTNSAAYGIFVQQNVTTVSRAVRVRVYRPDGSSFVKPMKKVETPGPYFHPLIATFITGGARLMLALAEHRVLTVGLDWAFCDTDSIAIAKPDGVAEDEFLRRAKGVVEWFRPLNPYGLDEPILKIEDVNYRPGNRQALEPLYCWAISSKRYALFNIGADGKPIIRKCSAHGLGHLMPPYEEGHAPAHIPAPLKEVTSGKERVQRWQYDAWWVMSEAVLAGRPDDVRFDYHPALQSPTVSRYAATSPELRRWFDGWNDGKEYPDQVKPFGFLYTLHASVFVGSAGEIPDPVEGSEQPSEMHPVAPFDRDLKAAISRAFDRVTGKPIDPARLQTYSEALLAYPNRPESKFLNGGAYESGSTERCHVVATEVKMIGKEADRWEEEYFLGLNGDLAIDYGSDPTVAQTTFERLRDAVEAFGKASVAEATGIARKTLTKIERGEDGTTRVPHNVVSKGLDRLWEMQVAKEAEACRRWAKIAVAIQREGGIRAAARTLGMDSSNLRKEFRNFQPSTAEC